MLNPQQVEAVEHMDGPCALLAGPGAGKTAVLTQRAARLVRSGVAPERVLLLTFTRASAREMLDRARQMEPACENISGGTFHSLATRMINRNAHIFGVEKFTILDPDDSRQVVKKLMEPMRAGEDNWPTPAAVAKAISLSTNTCCSMEEAMKKVTTRHLHMVKGFQEIRDAFVSYKLERSMLDYDDCLEYFATLLEDEDVGPRIREQWDYCLFDEYQDTNALQLRIVYGLAGERANVMVVGDAAQCLPEGEPVLTPNGNVPIETIKAEDRIMSGFGNGVVGVAKVQSTERRYVECDLVTITTESGRRIRTTPEHIQFAGFNDTAADKGWTVYLMYRSDLGYRIGMCSDQEKAPRWRAAKGFKYRSVQEGADHCYVLASRLDRQEARVMEMVWSLRYGIPTIVFNDRGQTAFGQDYIDDVFSKVDSRAGGSKLLDDLGIMKDWPHHRPKASHSGRCNFVVSICSSGRGHRYAISGSEDADREALSTAGLPVRKAKFKGWRLESECSRLHDAMAIYDRVSEVLPKITLVQKAKLSEEGSLNYMPSGNCLAGMSIFVHDEDANTVVKDTIASVTKEPYKGYVYDLNVERTHNFISGGIVTHNSIYGFRGSAPHTMTNFLARFPNARLLKLETNYRSSQEIVDLVNVADRLTRSGFDRTLVSASGRSGVRPVLLECQDEVAQSAEIGKAILAHKANGGEIRDVAILVRSMSFARRIEVELTTRKIPYKVTGGLRIDEAAHVKDLLSIARVATNHLHEPAWLRLLTRHKRIGDVAAAEIAERLTSLGDGGFAPEILENEARDRKTSFEGLPDALRSLSDPFRIPIATLTDAVAAMEPFWRDLKEWKDDWEDRRRDIDAILHIAAEHRDLDAFLTAVTLDYSVDVKKSDEGQREEEMPCTISTVHGAKGLEWPVVHIPSFIRGHMPSNYAEDMDEEARILYVALSRARRELVIHKPLFDAKSGYTAVSEYERHLRPHCMVAKAHQPASGGVSVDTTKRIDMRARLLGR